MHKKLILPCYGVVCGNTPALNNERRTPKVGFCSIPKSLFMFHPNHLKVEPYSRQLTVSYLHQFNGSVPFIRLCGKWLSDAGFSVDDKVNVTVKNNLLVIEPVK